MTENVLLSRPYTDTHFHLDLCQDQHKLIQRLVAGDVSVIAVTNAPFVFDACVKMVNGATHIQPAIGLHPELAVRCEGQLPLFLEKLTTTRFIGEVGLDYITQDMTERAIQRRVFETIVESADKRGDAFLTVHSRRAASDVIAVLGSAFNGTVVLHWFSGGMRELDRAVEAGLYFSINPAMVSSKKGRQLIIRMPRDRILTETDGPFVKMGARPAEPWDIVQVVEELARIWGVEPDSARAMIHQNLAEALAHERS